MQGNCTITQAEVVEALVASQPLLAQEILDYTIKTPSFMMDLPDMEPFPLGNGTQEQQLIVRGNMPPIERGFDKWNKLDNNAGCEPCEGPNCAYNWTQFGGLGIEKRIFSLMERDFRSQSYCVKNIQTTAHYKEFFGQFVKNLFRQITFFKEQNINFNYLTSLLRKYVVDSSGPRPNPANPYVYPAKGTATISALNIDLLSEFYEYMRLDPSVVPFDVVNGQPLFAAIMSPQLASRLYRNDAQLRADVRFSGLANDNVTKYNFVSSFRDMFINAPYNYPRRFRWVAEAGPVPGYWLEVLPFVDGIPLDIGSFTGLNPQWLNPGYATHEEVILHGKSPFKLKFLPTETTLGENTSFGPEQSYMNTWQWVNTLTDNDPGRRVGYFWTSATIAMAPQHATAYGILVERDPLSLTFVQAPQGVCPVTPEDCDNLIPDTGCPCPIVLERQINPISGFVVLTLATPIVPLPIVTDELNFKIGTGGFLIGTVEAINAEGDVIELSFPEGTDLGLCDHFVEYFCDNTMLCSANIQTQCVNGSASVEVVLSNAIKGDVADVLTVTYTDGTTGDATITAINYSTLTWTLTLAGVTDLEFGCNSIGLVSICVPPGVDASCPECGGPTYTLCAT